MEGALELRPQLAAADPSLPRLLEQSRHELGGSDALPPAPPFDASWAKGSGWARDPALEAALEAAGLDAEGGTVERRDASELTWGEFKATFRGEKEGTVGRPLLLTNATAGWAAHGAAWEKPELLRRYGGVSAAVRQFSMLAGRSKSSAEPPCHAKGGSGAQSTGLACPCNIYP